MIPRTITVYDHEPWCKSLIVLTSNPPIYQKCNCSDEAKAIQRIRDLHRPHTFMPDEASFIDDEPEIHCWHCATEIQNWYPGEPYPCPTIKALDSDQ